MQTESNRQEGSSIDGNTAYQFGQWRFFADLGELYDGETTTRLEPQVAKLLEHFLTHQHKVISRDELIAAVWDKRTVSDDAINRCVSILRQTLSPEDKNAYIETVVRKGYIAHFPAAPGAESPAARSPGLRKFLKLAALAGLVIVVIYLIAKPGGDSAGPVSETTRSGP
ncbi:MAG TPA: winged helix-turn-helix domain-containing protein, partial [Xanthomonadales bacterium]|nr:winged helix-turn-helix domain-containing protein [Xanthomonadales bacterium]